MQFAKQQHVQQAPTSKHSEHPQSSQHQQPQHLGGTGGGLGGAFGLGLPAPVLKTHGAVEGGSANRNITQSPQHSTFSGLLGGQQPSIMNPTGATSPAQNARYDPIKSLLNQLHQSDKVTCI